jgi:hypothetical protein
MNALVSLLGTMAALSGTPKHDEFLSAQHWFSLDLAHLSRSLPAFDRTIDVPLNPALQLGYHRRLLGRGALSAAFSLQAGFEQFDRLFWELFAGGGLEGVYRSRLGLFSALGFRLDLARAFTGRNHFILEGSRYAQKRDAGRGFLRVSLIDLTAGYSPELLRRWGIVPALRYAWTLEAPLYTNTGGTTWSYTTFGLSILWMWGGGL